MPRWPTRNSLRLSSKVAVRMNQDAAAQVCFLLTSPTLCTHHFPLASSPMASVSLFGFGTHLDAMNWRVIVLDSVGVCNCTTDHLLKYLSFTKTEWQWLKQIYPFDCPGCRTLNRGKVHAVSSKILGSKF